MRYPPTKQLSDEEMNLLWKFRFYLTRDKKALTKFLKCVIWTDAVEAKQAVELLNVWVDIDVEDALELLGPNFEDENVRTYAVEQLHKADDEDLVLYLLQLVQALKFEALDKKHSVMVSPLVEFLIDRGVQNPILGNYLYWYLLVECEDTTASKIFSKVAHQFVVAITGIPDGVTRRDILKRQGDLVATLTKLSKDLRVSKEARPKKIEKLREFISEPKNGLVSFPPLPLPIDPRIQVTGLIPGNFIFFLIPVCTKVGCLYKKKNRIYSNPPCYRST